MRQKYKGYSKFAEKNIPDALLNCLILKQFPRVSKEALEPQQTSASSYSVSSLGKS
jgi:hypothetical protein